MTVTINRRPTGDAEDGPVLPPVRDTNRGRPFAPALSARTGAPLPGQPAADVAHGLARPAQASGRDRTSDSAGNRSIHGGPCRVAHPEWLASPRCAAASGECAARVLVCGALDGPARARMHALLARGAVVAHVENFEPDDRLLAAHDIVVVEGAGAGEWLAAAVSGLASRASVPVLAVFAPTRAPVREQRRALCAIGAGDALPATAPASDHVFRLDALLRRSVAPTVLVVKNDPEAGRSAEEALLAAGWAVTLVDALASARETYVGGRIDAIVIDPELPDGDGLSFLRALRRAGAMTPVLVESGRPGREHRLAALTAGADDFTEAALDEEELQLRARRLLRSHGAGRRIVFGALEFFLDDEVVRHRAQRIKLRPREYEMLAYLARLAGMTVPRHILLEDVWSTTAGPDAASAVAVTKSRLARALRVADVPSVVISESGGYRFDPSPLRRAAIEAPTPAASQETGRLTGVLARRGQGRRATHIVRSDERTAAGAPAHLRTVAARVEDRQAQGGKK